MTALQAYDCLKLKAAPLSLGSHVSFHPEDWIDLRKLKVSELGQRGFSTKIADDIAGDLTIDILVKLGEAMGIVLIKLRMLSVSRVTHNHPLQRFDSK